jgi:hypothetical protein
MLQNVLGSCEVVSSALVFHDSRVKQIGWTLKSSLVCILVGVCLKLFFHNAGETRWCCNRSITFVQQASEISVHRLVFVVIFLLL